MPQTDPDPFWSDKALFPGDTPLDYSENHDDYLYGEIPSLEERVKNCAREQPRAKQAGVLNHPRPYGRG